MTDEDSYRIKLRLATLNTNGINDNYAFINKLRMYSDILFLCETWHKSHNELEEALYLLNKTISSKTGLKLASRGRTPGGIAFIVNSELNSTCTFISRNIGILKINKLAIIGVYLAYKDSTDTKSSEMQFELECNLLRESINDLENNGYEVIIMGDFNVDFAKPHKHNKILIQMMNMYNLAPVDIYKPQEVSCTYLKKCGDGWNKSWIDHVLIKKQLFNAIDNCAIAEDPTNRSDHHAIITIYNLKCSKTFKSSHRKEDPLKSIKINWKDPEQVEVFKEKVRNGLAALESEMNAITKEQDKIKLKLKLTILLKNISNCLIDATRKTANFFKHTKCKSKVKRKFNSWWDDECQKLFSLVQKWYLAYKETDFVNEFYRKKYHEAKTNFRARKRFNMRLKREYNLLRISKLFKTTSDKFWREINKLQRERQSIDIKIKDIEDLYKNLFNTTNKTNTLNDAKVKEKVDDYVNTYGVVNFNVKINEEKIIDYISQLETGKAVGISGVTNEMVIHSLCTDLTKMLAKFFSVCISNSVVPSLFNICIIKPLIKNASKPSNSLDNLRPVAVSDCISNMFESVILERLTSQIPDKDKQFGFKPESSCHHAMFVLRQAVKAAKYENKKVFACAIDVSKAFDRVNRDHLWLKLIKYEVDAPFVLSLRAYYNEALMLVLNNEECSSAFRTTVGVRQGGVVSPKLFSVYMDELVDLITNCESGTFIGEIKIDIILYADDILLLARTMDELQEQLKIVENYGVMNDIKFNAAKTNFIVFNQESKALNDRDGVPTVKLDNQTLIQVKEMRYLGYHVTEDNNLTAHVEKRKKITLSKIATLRYHGILDDQFSIESRVVIFKAYIRSVLSYGYENVEINEITTKGIRRFEGNFIKKMISMPVRCHATNLLLAMNIIEPDLVLKKAKLSFFVRLLENKYTCSLLDEVLKHNMSNSFTKEISVLLEVKETVNLACLRVLAEEALAIIARIKDHIKRIDDTVVNEIRTLLKKNDSETKARLFELIKVKSF